MVICRIRTRVGHGRRTRRRRARNFRLSLTSKTTIRTSRCGLRTGRRTIFAGGGFPVVNGLATILHTVFSWLDYLHPKPSLLTVVLAVALIGGTIAYLRRRPNAASVK